MSGLEVLFVIHKTSAMCELLFLTMHMTDILNLNSHMHKACHAEVWIHICIKRGMWRLTIRWTLRRYGVVYLAREALRHKLDTSLKGKRCVVSGCGNVAQHTMEKLLHLDAVVLGCSDSKGCILKPSGLTVGDLEMIKHNHNVDRKRLQDLDLEDAKYFAGESIWYVGTDDLVSDTSVWIEYGRETLPCVHLAQLHSLDFRTSLRKVLCQWLLR